VAVLSFAAPAFAADPGNIGTTVTVISGTGVPPVVKALWAHDPGVDVTSESADPSHGTVGVQIKPNMGFQASKDITFCAIVTDLAGVANITHVYADIYYPATGATDPGKNGDLKFEVELTRHGTDDFMKTLFDNAYAAGPNDPSQGIYGMTTINTGATDPSYNQPINKADIDQELDQQLAVKYWGTYHFDNCQLAGRYTIVINAFNGQAKVGSFSGWFDWSALAAADFDFNGIKYGNVVMGVHKQIGGDRVWDTPVDTAPIPNKATIANAGNTYLKMTVKEDDMGLGQTQINGSTVWNVHYDFRLGDGDPSWTNEGFVNYDPAVAKGGNLAGASSVSSMQILKLCAVEKVDFSIQVDKDLNPGSEKVGNMIIGVVKADGPATNPVESMYKYVPPAKPTPTPP